MNPPAPSHLFSRQCRSFPVPVYSSALRKLNRSTDCLLTEILCVRCSQVCQGRSNPPPPPRLHRSRTLPAAVMPNVTSNPPPKPVAIYPPRSRTGHRGENVLFCFFSVPLQADFSG